MRIKSYHGLVKELLEEEGVRLRPDSPVYKLLNQVPRFSKVYIPEERDIDSLIKIAMDIFGKYSNNVGQTYLAMRNETKRKLEELGFSRASMPVALVICSCYSRYSPFIYEAEVLHALLPLSTYSPYDSTTFVSFHAKLKECPNLSALTHEAIHTTAIDSLFGFYCLDRLGVACFGNFYEDNLYQDELLTHLLNTLMLEKSGLGIEREKDEKLLRKESELRRKFLPFDPTLPYLEGIRLAEKSPFREITESFLKLL